MDLVEVEVRVAGEAHQRVQGEDGWEDRFLPVREEFAFALIPIVNMKWPIRPVFPVIR